MIHKFREFYINYRLYRLARKTFTKDEWNKLTKAIEEEERKHQRE